MPLIAHPRHWPLALGIGLVRLLIRLPLSWQRALGRSLGRLSGRLIPRRRRIAEINLCWCFPELDEARRARLLRAQLESVGLGLLETAWAWWLPDRRLDGLAEIEGLEHLHAARDSSRGVLLLTGHFTCLELGARFLTPHCRFHAMYRPHANSYYQDLMRRAREHHSGLPAITQNDIRATVRALRHGDAVWYAPDQNYGRQSVFVPFFGIPALTITATSRLVRMSNALVLPYFPRRLADGRYRVTILPPLTDFPGDDIEDDTARINTLIEDWVRQAPEQYLWVHRRFKKRPGGEPPPY